MGATEQWLAANSKHILGQDEAELRDMLEIVGRGTSLLEIGSRFGECIRRMALSMPAGSKVVSVDRGLNPPIPVEVDIIGELRKRLATLTSYETYLIVGDSHAAATKAAVQMLAPFDFIFIDGDHSQDGVRQDWDDYGWMGKAVGFHDIVIEPGVRALWGELKSRYDSMEIVHGRLGIGIIFPHGSPC